jgi:hypothetical protein
MATAFQKKLAGVAQQQFTKYRFKRENQEPLATQIEAYWTDIGLNFASVAEPWSAVFVSWCVKRAGATAAQFVFAAAHAKFVYAAIANADNESGVFRGRDVAKYAPKVGDILQNNRSGNHFDFVFASTHKAYESHSAIVIEVGADSAGRYLRTIGGNESDSVGMKEVRLTPSGLVKNTDGLYISVIETLL